MKIGIIGAGWYGCHLALSLTRIGYDVTIFEKKADIFCGVSGNFGIRLHRGPHYPRSEKTRESCKAAFDEFTITYPDLLVPHESSIYALGDKDAHNNPPRVNVEKFEQVCQETQEAHKIDFKQAGFQGLQVAYELEEPSIVLGSRLRSLFREKLEHAKVKLVCSYHVKELQQQDDCVLVVGLKGDSQAFQQIINATGYQDFRFTNLRQNFPVDLEVVYQPCLALIYEDKEPHEKPFSFIVMDGWFPCLMPCIEELPFKNRYILTHGSYTIAGSFETPDKAHDLLRNLNDEFIKSSIKPLCEKEMHRFWPGFADRFNYLGWKGEVLAKIKTKCEFRSAVTFESERVIHIIPGKVSNIFDAEREVVSLITNKHCLVEKGIRLVRDGILELAKKEIEEKPALGEPNTCSLNTYHELTHEKTSSIVPFSLFTANTKSSPTSTNVESDKGITNQKAP